jgi:hypothetical protein
MTDISIDRPSHWLQWAEETFGPVALDRRERLLRFMEEAVELSHAMGLDAATVEAIVRRVHSRPAGDIRREAGQVQACFECLVRVLGVDADAEATSELARVKTIPTSEWAIRHAAKVAIGIAES